MTIIVQTDDGKEIVCTQKHIENFTVGTNQDGSSYLVATWGELAALRLSFLQWATMVKLPKEFVRV